MVVIISPSARDACKPQALKCDARGGYYRVSRPVAGLWAERPVFPITRWKGPAHCRADSPWAGGAVITTEGPQSRDGVRPLAQQFRASGGASRRASAHWSRFGLCAWDDGAPTYEHRAGKGVAPEIGTRQLAPTIQSTGAP